MSKGFTLIELLAVLSIMSIIAILAYPVYNNVSANIKKSSLENKEQTIATNMKKFAEEYLIDDIKPAGTTCSTSTTCCKRYDLYKYIVANAIYSSETTVNNVSSIINPITNNTLYGYVEISYNTSTYSLSAKFVATTSAGTSSTGISNCGV